MRDDDDRLGCTDRSVGLEACRHLRLERTNEHQELVDGGSLRWAQRRAGACGRAGPAAAAAGAADAGPAAAESTARPWNAGSGACRTRTRPWTRSWRVSRDAAAARRPGGRRARQVALQRELL